MRRLLAVWLIAALALVPAGCGGPAGEAGERATTATQDAAYNETDVMFAQMSVAHISQGDQVVALAERRATGTEVRQLAAELRSQWRTESATMTGWLTAWGQPLAADPNAGAHAGHGDLHSLRASDIAELAAARGADFDRTALSLLVGHLHNCVETSRLEAGGGKYPPAISLAATMTTTRQAQVQKMLTLLA